MTLVKVLMRFAMINPISKLKTSLLAILVLLFVASCTNEAKEAVAASPKPKNYQAIGDSLSTISQQTLLMKVSAAITSGGPVHAIDFCTLNASNLMDSLSKQYQVKIARITSKPRNTSNEATQLELEILKALESSGRKDTVVSSDGQVTYYKAIQLGMPTCLKCHGSPKTDISEETLNAIQKYYPKDLAKNYHMGDFRGAWKIQFLDQ